MRPTIHLTLSPDVVKVGREEAARRGVSLSRLVELLVVHAAAHSRDAQEESKS